MKNRVGLPETLFEILLFSSKSSQPSPFFDAKMVSCHSILSRIVLSTSALIFKEQNGVSQEANTPFSQESPLRWFGSDSREPAISDSSGFQYEVRLGNSAHVISKRLPATARVKTTVSENLSSHDEEVWRRTILPVYPGNPFKLISAPKKIPPRFLREVSLI